MTRLPLRFLLAATLALAGCHTHPSQAPTASSTAPVTTAPKSATKYIDAKSIAQLEAALPAPPTDRGALSRGEGDLLLAVQTEASATARTRAATEDNLQISIFVDVLGPGFAREKMPLTDALLRQVEHDSKVVSDGAKDKWSRSRPPVQDNRVTPTLAVPKSMSYPSGHAIRSMVWARVLAMLAPEKEKELLQRARLVAYDRVVAGVHYPTDVAAGMSLGGLIADQLGASPAFQSDLAKARAEWPLKSQ